MLENPKLWQGSVLVGGMALLILAETLWPRSAAPKRWRHYPLNLSLMLSNQLVLWLLFKGLERLPLHGSTLWVGPMAGLTWQLNLVLGIILLDGLIYLQHRLFHRIPWLWRLHAVHHSEREMDVTSGVRFHSGELLISLLYKTCWAWLLGISWFTLAIFEIWLMAMALWTHSNLRLSQKAEQWLSYVLVTPAFHLRHHSLQIHEQQRNFSGGLVWWDWWGKTEAEAVAGPFETGLKEIPAPKSRLLKDLWWMPIGLSNPD